LNDTLNSLIRQKIDLKDHGTALEMLAPLRRKQPSNPWWNYLTAFSLHLQGRDLSEALELYGEALQHTPETDPEEFWIRYNRGTLLHQLGHRDLALADLKRAVRLQPSHAGARALLRELMPSGWARWLRLRWPPR
jgi:tetratricopeptide (TPR) repeat protein